MADELSSAALSPEQAMLEPATTQRLALRRQEAARALGISDEVFDTHVRPHLPVVRLGSVRVYPVDGLRTFLAERASSPAQDVGAAMNPARRALTGTKDAR